MDRTFAITVPQQKDPLECVYKQFDALGPKFLFVTIDKLQPHVTVKSGTRNLLIVSGTKKGKQGRTVNLVESTRPNTVTRFRNMTVEQMDSLFIALCSLGVTTESGSPRGATCTWTVTDSRKEPKVQTDSVDIPVFLNK